MKIESVLIEKIHADGKNPNKISPKQFDKPSQSKLHPTLKPIALISQLILNSSSKGQIILDLFGGSGSTLIACGKLGRKCRMVELDEHYCDCLLYTSRCV